MSKVPSANPPPVRRRPFRRVIGLDPGTRLTGYGVVEGDGHQLRRIASGVIDLRKISVLSGRLVTLHEEVESVIRRFEPDEAAVEDLFHHKNAMSALKLGHARGVLLMCAARSGLPVYPYSPSSVKQYVTGYGRAEKGQVADMVQFLVGIDATKARSDETDALAVAICHIFHCRDGILGGDPT